MTRWTDDRVRVPKSSVECEWRMVQNRIQPSMLDGHQHLGRRNCFCLPGGEAMSPIPFRPELNSSQDVTHWNPSFGEVFWEMSFGRTTVEWSTWFSWGSSCFCGCRKGACCRSQGDAKVRMTVIAQISMLIYINLGEDARSSFGMKRYRTAPRDSLQIPLQPLNKMSEGHRHRLWSREHLQICWSHWPNSKVFNTSAVFQ